MTLTTLHRSMTALTLAMFAPCFGSAAIAQTYPAKPVRVLVGFAAGSSTDVAMRLIGPRLGEILGQNVLVDNRAGAGGNIAAELTAKAPADGYTLLFANGGIAIAQSYYTRLEYNALKDLAPVALVTSMPHIVCSNLAFPAKTIKELVALAKKRPGDILFSSAGIGNSDHMAGELFGYMTGSQYTHVPNKGGPQALQQVISGEVVFYMAGLPVCLPHVKSGKLKLLAVTESARSPQLPDTPTVAETLPGYELAVWYGAFSPKDLPKDITERLNTEINRIVALPEVRSKMAAIGVEVVSSTSESFAKTLQQDAAKYTKLIRELKITAE
jgi:tripartite-type tricarboxylate transporter receptor subunit TctC